MNAATKRRAHAYAVRAMRQLGRELTSGMWMSNTGAMSALDAAAIMGRALATTLRLGIETVSDEVDVKLRELLDDVVDGLWPPTPANDGG